MIKYKKLCAFFKFILFVLLVTQYFTIALLTILFFLFSIERARPYLLKNISLHAKLCLKLFNIHLKKCTEEKSIIHNYFIVSNHLSYLDIIIIASTFPTAFVTSIEMKKTPILGQICLLGGCLFVERRSRNNLHHEVDDITKTLSKNLNVVVFPEATSTNGDQILTFKKPLFQSAIDSNKEILPLCLNYKKINNVKINKFNRDRVFWYGDMPFFSHFLKMLELEKIEVEFNILKKIFIDSLNTKSDLSELAYQKIKENYVSV